MFFEVIKEKCDEFNKIINSGDFLDKLCIVEEILDELLQILPKITIFPINQNISFPICLYQFITKCESDKILEKCYLLLNKYILKNSDACDVLVDNDFHLFAFSCCTKELSPISGLFYESLAILCENNEIALNKTSHCIIFDFIVEHYKESGFPHIQTLKLIEACGKKFSYSQCTSLFPYLNEIYEKEGFEIPTIQVMTSLIGNCNVLIETFEKFGIIKKLTNYILEIPINNFELVLAILEFLVACCINTKNKQLCHLFISEEKLYENLAIALKSIENKSKFIKCIFDVSFVDKNILKIIHDSPLQEELKKCIYESSDWKTERNATLVIFNEFFNNIDEYRDLVMDSEVFDSMISILQSSDTKEKMFILDNICTILRKGFDVNGTMLGEVEFIDEVMELDDCGISSVELKAKEIEDIFVSF